MKKLMTASLLSVLLFTACGDSKADAEISDTMQTSTASVEITETTISVGESGIIIHDSETEKTDARQLTSVGSVEIALLEENIESAAETTVTETVPETKPTTAETEETTTTTEASEVRSVGAYAADKSSLVGTWYAINSEGFDGLTYIFDEDGTVTAFDAYEKEIGTYTVNDGLLELTSSYEDEAYINSFAAVIENGVLVMDHIGLNTELIREEYVPYTEDISVYDYFHEVGTITGPLFLSKEKSVLAEQSDILGEWTVFENGEAAGKCIFDENGITEIRDGYEETAPIILKGGRAAYLGEIPENVSLSDDIISYLCGEKLYSFDNVGFPTIYEK